MVQNSGTVCPTNPSKNGLVISLGKFALGNTLINVVFAC